MVRVESVRQRIDVLLDALSDLRRYRSSVPRDVLLADRDSQHMVLHAMYVAAQAAIDIALHALADAEQPLTNTYREAFQRLGAMGMLDAELARRLEGWAGLRNVLAHFYGSIDYGLVHDALVNDIGDLEELARLAATWLDESAPG
jgi:uncharacterized protein YutE (UPF0331/DUF86 family)